MKEAGEVRTEVMYVDRDRAAAVTLGSKDIRSDMKSAQTGKRGDEEGNTQDEKNYLTFMTQGQFEFK